MDEVLFEARPGRRLPLAISVGAAIYPQDGDSYEALHDFVRHVRDAGADALRARPMSPRHPA